jgi:integrase
MPLNLYRRHHQECAAGRPRWSTNGEFEERNKQWKRCGCPIIAAGSIAKVRRKRSTGRFDWAEARQVADRWEAAARWPDDSVPHPVPEVPATDPSKITIERAISAYMDSHKHSAFNTRKQYGYLMDKLRAYSTHKGYTLIEQWGPVDVREFRDTWKMSVPTANRTMSILRALFGFCVSMEWITRNPAKLVRNPKGKSSDDGSGEQKLPFTDSELQRMYDVCETKYGKMEIKWDRGTHAKPADGLVNSYRYSWTGKDLADFISVSVYTGLRISDVATFHISRLRPNGEVWVRTTKSGTDVCTWVPEWLQQVIRRRSLEVDALIFGKHETKDLNVITDIWRRKLKRLWRMCGKWEDKPTPHRFRHTFATKLLQHPDVSYKNVADLLGNSEAMVRKHYGAWTAARQAKLTATLKEAFKETPRPLVDNVVEMPTKQAR